MSVSVGTERVSKVMGYSILPGNFSTQSPNLPQRINVLGEANEANQATLILTPWKVTSLKDVGDRYGYGSPIYLQCRILYPPNGGGIGGIPVYIYPQAAAVGATSKIWEVAVTGTPTGNGTHTIKIAGRSSVDGASYDINITTSDTAATIHAKIVNAVNNVLGSPVTATDFGYEVDLESKWKGETADGITVSVDTGKSALGLTYTITSVQSGSGTPSIQAALDLFGNEWATIVVNAYGVNSSTMSLLEAFNGIPSPTNPTGRYLGVVMKPFVALTGSVADNDSAVTDLRKDQVTIVICPAPLSTGLQFEAAANYAVLLGRQAQDEPQLDISGSFLPDMPTPDSIGTMADYNSRDTYVKMGNSTVDLVAGKYKVMDFVTTYHPVGENPPQFRKVRSLVIDFNIKFAWYLILEANVVDHAIASDDQIVNANKVVKPKQVVALWVGMALDLGRRGLIADVTFMQDNITVTIDGSNPDRLNIEGKYKRSGFVVILSSDVTAGFNFGE